MAFFTLLNIFVLVVINFAQYFREQKLKKDLLYDELLDTHKKLKEYAQKIEELTILEERNRIARDIHDTLGHMMTGIIMELEMASHIIDKDTGKAKKLLKASKTSAREGLSKIRQVVETLKPDKQISKGIDSIKELIDEFSQKTGVDIDLNIIGSIKKLTPTVSVTLYRVVQESLTNAVRHGKATKIIVNISLTKEKIEFQIKDNGIGDKDIKLGFGLKGMTERVRALHGEIEFKVGDGFIVRGYIPGEV
ncbi:two-component sensor histidine kinase [Caldisalinibacter kiritimatiensis]|uniref:histidine kinase n=2 Tax=Caldisalinibacter kiritimatiensis TaxID=1304284 RepID=R1ASD0_9FIRM|nr:two-component sensor histidine kinase [Caldisalinibacter kiritimatiensis]